MNTKFIGFLATVFIGATALNRILEGTFITASDVGILNTLTITHEETLFGQFSIPMLNFDFFFVGIPRLVKWDYSFFGGNAALFQYLFYSLTFFLAFFLFLALVGMVAQRFAGR